MSCTGSNLEIHAVAADRHSVNAMRHSGQGCTCQLVTSMPDEPVSLPPPCSATATTFWIRIRHAHCSAVAIGKHERAMV